MLVTRPGARERPLLQKLGELSDRLAFVIVPLIEFESIETGDIHVGDFDWVVLTSATAAEELRRRAKGRARRVAAIGRATAEAWGGNVDLVPAVSTQEGLLAELPRPAGRVLFAAAEGARRLLVDELDAEFVPLYRTKAVLPSEPVHGDVVVLMSPSAARAMAEVRTDIPAVTIGPETTAAARRSGLRVLREAATHDVDGVAAALLDVAR